MKIKRAVILSLALHGLVLGLLLSKFNWSPKPAKSFTALEAKLMLRDKKRSPDLLPRKPVVKKPLAQPLITTPAPAQAQAQAKQDLLSKPKVEQKKIEAKKQDYAQELARLSESFAADLAVEAKDTDEIMQDDGSYFDQIYSLIKRSFVVPSHLNGPQGQNLQAVLRLFLSSDGHLARLELEHSSGDEQFDNAVMDGTRRVNNFGAVPIMLQAALSANGILIEMCPFKCHERQDG
jgi:outer membrane biosynthesis protein TonB